MSKVVLYMSMSVDGFIACPDDGMGQGLGAGGERLFDGLKPEHIELDLIRTLAGPGVLHLRYEVRRS